MRIQIAVANATQKQAVYRLRHEVYSAELGQYAAMPDGVLPDAEGVESVYIVAMAEGELLGFVGITPPTSPHFSVDRHIARQESPVRDDGRLHEIRALTVRPSCRNSQIAGTLMYAAFRWVQSRGGKQIVAMGRREVLDLYLRHGLTRTGRRLVCGAVTYELISGKVEQVASLLQGIRPLLTRLQSNVDWQLDIPFHIPAECYHGGAFFEAIGEGFGTLERSERIINADVLDAWFPPAPEAQEAIANWLPWIMRTSPPTRAEGLTEAIAAARGVPPESILTGGGSSSLIFLAFRTWLSPASRVLVLDPTYGEYLHVLESIVQCHVERFALRREEGYRVNLDRLSRKLAEGFDLFVWVNPNSPTGRHVSRQDVEKLLSSLPGNQRVWLDETYVDYIGRDQSLEPFAAQSDNVIVCKSMSKVYALSGMRVAYLCASPHQLEAIRLITPPWSVGLAAQIAATKALQANDYYQSRYLETHRLREQLAEGLRTLGVTEIVPSVANFLLCHLPPGGKTAEETIAECQTYGLYLRDVSGMGTSMGSRAVRIAVKDARTNRRMLAILSTVLGTAACLPAEPEPAHSLLE